MALLFPRLAHNFACQGYYPTEVETLVGIFNALMPSYGSMRLFDPCAGEGAALLALSQFLGADRTETYGIEYDEERAWAAKSVLNRCLHADMQHCTIGRQSFGLLFLNPPYGDLVSDKTNTGFVQKGRARLEKLFYQRTVGALQWDGILALIVPHYVLDKEFAGWLSHGFRNVQVYRAPIQDHQQVVVMGVRVRSDTLSSSEVATTKARLLAVGQGETLEVMPTDWPHTPYQVPAATSSEVNLFTSEVDLKQLEVDVAQQACLWPQFMSRFHSEGPAPRQPLLALSPWHLALALAAGQVSGVVTADDGRSFIIKGDTYKDVQKSSTFEEREDGECVEVVTQLDKFIPVIRAIDMTPDSETFGHVLIIR